eukprot:jgi/Orpsp1_1/1176419/evm.model.c7180000057515.2
MKCKGTPQATVIREKSSEEIKGETSQEFIERLYKENKDKLKSEKEKSTNNNNNNNNNNNKSNKNTQSNEKEKKLNNTITPSSSNTVKKPLIEEIDKEIKPKIETPKYKIVHRGEIQISNYVNDRTYTHNNRPTSLLITIELPKMIRQSEADLEISENTLDLYTSNDNVPIEVIDENGNPIKTDGNDPFIQDEIKNRKEMENEGEGNKIEKEKEDKEDNTKKITDYAVVLYDNSKIPKSKIHQTMEQIEILLYIPDVILSSINTKFLGNTFYLEAQSQENHQLYQYLIKLANSVNIEECGFMVVDAPKDQETKEEKKSEIPETVKAVKCLIPKVKSEWWSNNIFEIRPKKPTTIVEKNNEEKDPKETTVATTTTSSSSSSSSSSSFSSPPPPLTQQNKFIDYIYKDGETNTDLFEFNEKIFLTELFVNKLDEYLTKQENQPKNKKEDEMPQWLRDAINPPKKAEQNKVIELTEEELIHDKIENTETSTAETTTTKITEPEITLKANDIIFDLDDIDF